MQVRTDVVGHGGNAVNGAYYVGSGVPNPVPLDASIADGKGLVADARQIRELCHDLVEPAAVIKVLAQAALAELAPDSATRIRLRTIASEAARITDMCGQVLDRRVRMSPVPLDTLAAEAMARARLHFDGDIDGAVQPVTVLANQASLTRVLDNLLSNAVQAAGPDGQVRVEVAAEADRAKLSVADSGTGLSGSRPEQASLGLEITARLVLSCGGTLQMNMSDLGGLCVTVGLPR